MEAIKRTSLFIAFEGIDGSGKSTQLRRLTEFLQRKGYKVHTTAEPTTRPIGRMIRDIFNHRMEADNRTIAGLFVADRLDHILNKDDGMLRLLDEGYIVITDRYYMSSYAYQGAHVPLEWVIGANSLASELLRPDITIFIDMPVGKALDRVRKGRNTLELFETEDNIRQVSAMYEKVIKMIGSDENIVRINGDRSEDEVADEIETLVVAFLHDSLNS